MKDDQGRSDFALSIIVHFYPQKGVDLTFETVFFLLKNFAPDLVLAVVTSLQALLADAKRGAEFWSSFDLPQFKSLQEPIEQVLTLLGFIGQDETDTLRHAVIQTLLSKLQDDALTVELGKLLKDLFLETLFPEPANITPTFKKVLVSVLESVHAFFQVFNTALEKGKAAKMNQEATVINALIQLATGAGILKTSEKGKEGAAFLESCLRSSLEELLDTSLFSSAGKPSSPMEKLLLKIVSGFIFKLTDVLITPTTLIRILLKIITQPVDTANAFDREMKDLKFFDASDQKFSQDLDRLVNGLSLEILKVYSDTGTALSVGKILLKLSPSVGADIQRALNRNFQSGAVMMPFFLLSQLLFQMNEWKVEKPEDLKKLKQKTQLQANMLKFLETPVVTFDLEKLMRATKEEQEGIHHAGDFIVFEEPKDLVRLLESLPFGTRNFALELIQRLFRYARHDAFLKILFAYVLSGVKKGLTK